MANPVIDVANELQFVDVLPAAAYNTNNAASAGVDMMQFKGRPALAIDFGVGSGTTPVVTAVIQTSATNNASNAVNFSGGTLNPITNPGSNNAAVVKAVVPIDVRAANRYLFVRLVFTGTSPAFPIHAQLIGTPAEI